MNKFGKIALSLGLGLIVLWIISGVLAILRTLFPVLLLAAIAYVIYTYIKNK